MLPLSPEAASELVRRALDRWGMDIRSSSIIRHNENLACRIEDSDGKAYLLRICLPRTRGWVGVQQDKDALASELAWLQAVRQDTGLKVQEPVPSRGERLVESVPGPDRDSGREVPCMLLTWVDGQMFNQKEPDAAYLAAELGRVQAKLHAHARAWQPPRGFRRPVYDEASLIAAMPDLARGEEAGVIRSPDYVQVREAATRIVDLMGVLPRTRDTWGLIHADLPGNLVVTCGPEGRADLVPIDFSLSGLGYYLTDVAICICNLKKPFREPYLEGYGVAFDDEQRYQISAFIMMMIFISAAKNVFNPLWRDWFTSRRLPLIAGEYCPKLMRGEPFLMDI